MKCKIPATLFAALLLTAASAVSSEETRRGFADVSELHIETLTGNIEITKSDDDRVQLVLVHPSRNRDFEPLIRQRGERLFLKEDDTTDSWFAGAATWKLAVPDGLALRVASGSGDANIRDVKAHLTASMGTGNVLLDTITGDIEVSEGSGDVTAKRLNGEVNINTGSGKVRIDQSQGRFDINAGNDRLTLSDVSGTLTINQGTGDVTARALTLTGASRMSSGTGDISLQLSSPLDHDLVLLNGTGDVIVDYNGHPISGLFVMRAHARDGEISAPFPFDKEYIDNRQGDPVMVKIAQRGTGKHEIRLTTGTGLAQVVP